MKFSSIFYNYTTEKNNLIILTNLHLLRGFWTIFHRSDRVPTDAVFVPVKRYLLHENNKILKVCFFCPQGNALTNMICHMIPSWSMITMIILNSEIYSLDQNSIIYYNVYVLNCLFWSFDILKSLIIVYGASYTSLYS